MYMAGITGLGHNLSSDAGKLENGFIGRASWLGLLYFHDLRGHERIWSRLWQNRPEVLLGGRQTLTQQTSRPCPQIVNLANYCLCRAGD